MLTLSETTRYPEEWTPYLAKEDEPPQPNEWLKTASKVTTCFLGVDAFVIFFGAAPKQKPYRLRRQSIAIGPNAPPPPEIVIEAPGPEVPAQPERPPPAPRAAPLAQIGPRRPAYAALRCTKEDKRMIHEIVASSGKYCQGKNEQNHVWHYSTELHRL